MKRFLISFLTLIFYSSLTYGDENTISNLFLNKPILYPQIMENGKANYFRYIYDPLSNPLEARKRLFTIALEELRYPNNLVAMNRFDKSYWLPHLLEKAKMDPWSQIDDEIYDSDVDEVELIGVINASITCVLNAFKKFDVYSSYIRDEYFIYSYELNNNEKELLKLKPTEDNELYHYSIFYPSSLIGAYQSVVKYQIERSNYKIKGESSTIKVPQISIAWELIPIESFSSLPGRGNKKSIDAERAWRDQIDREMFANSGYMIFEPLLLNHEPQGEYEECSNNNNNNNICVQLNAKKKETLAHGSFYFKPDMPLGDYPFIRQNIMDSIMNAIFSGLRDVIEDAKTEKIIKIEGCE